MPTLIRTLTAQDADILARTTIQRTVTGGRVNAHSLSWKSDALRTWELEQRQRHKDPMVEVCVNEFDLLQVYVRPVDQSLSYLMAESTTPLYARGLSLFEHERIQELAKKRHDLRELARMSDQEMYRLRLEYKANLGKQSDPVSRRRLELLKDMLSRGQSLDKKIPDSPECAEAPPAEPPKPRKKRSFITHKKKEEVSSATPPPVAESKRTGEDRSTPATRIKAMPTFSIPRR